MSETVIHVGGDVLADTLAGHWRQGDYGNDKAMCLHGAIRRCCPVPGDAYLWSAVRRHLTQFEPITSAADMDALASEIADAVLAVLLTPPPAPPWPGAVLSGLTDEDGVPTWLAQAGQVRGEQVRACTSVPWLPNTSYGEDEWVEVRAPRAVPAALVTVTIPAETAHALLRYIEDGDYDTDYVIDRLADLLIAAMDGDQ